MEANKTATIRFGMFELDPASGELRKHGTRLRLQEQPFQVLLALLERPGEVVSREELQQRLWPDGTFVDYEDGLATAVRKVRAALGDSATNPRFVETLPKRGYRFLAPVEHSAEAAHASPEPPPPQPKPHRWLYIALAASLGSLALLLSGAFFTEKDVPGPPLLRFVLAPGEDVHDPVVSPNGRYVVFVTRQGEGALWIREMSADQPRRVPDSAGAASPLWAPDGGSVVFQSGERLLRVEVPLHSAPTDIGEAGKLRSFAWSLDGEWFYSGRNRRAVKGGPWEPVLKRDGSEFDSSLFYAGDPVWLPLPNRRILMLYKPEHNEEPGGIHLVDYDSGEVRIVTSGSDPAWSPSGHIVFQEEGSVPRLRALGFSLETLEPTGDSFVIAENATRPSVSRDGKLVYLSGAGAGLQVVMRDRSGRLARAITPVLQDPQYVSVSPSGEEVAFTALTGEDREIWIAKTAEEQGEPHRLTFNDTSEGYFLWSPGGERMLYRVKGNAEAPESYFVVQSIRDGRVERLPADGIPAQWWGDGEREYLLYGNYPGEPGSLDYGEAKSGGSFTFKTFRKPFSAYSQLSPEGDLIAHMTWLDREFLIQPFPSGQGLWQLAGPGERISNRSPRWSRAKQEIFYRAGDQMRVASYVRDPGFRVVERRTLFRSDGLGALGHFDVMPDGEHFILLDVLRSEKPALRVTQNWFAEFADR